MSTWCIIILFTNATYVDVVYVLLLKYYPGKIKLLAICQKEHEPSGKFTWFWNHCTARNPEHPE